MHHDEAEILFPHSLIPSLRDLRGPVWASLVDRTLEVEEAHPFSLAFIMMMIELGGCLPCNSRSYKFLQGCQVCSARTIRCYKGSDEDLVSLFEDSLREVNRKLPALYFQFEAARVYATAPEVTLD